MSKFERSELLLGSDSTQIFARKKVAIFGVGGVGSYALEGLVRSGVGEFLLVDNDFVDESNINRQLIALETNIGMQKVNVAKERVIQINSSVIVKTSTEFVLPDNLEQFDLKNYDYVVDCIDTVSTKIALAEYCYNNNINIISAMGTGNKLTPLQFEITDISKTIICPLAKVMRKELKDRGVKKLTVCYSKEEIQKRQGTINEDGSHKRPTTASLPYVPSVCGLMIAYHVAKELLED